jgi:hypothetical protein
MQNEPAAPPESPISLRERATKIRSHARNFPDDSARRRLDELAAELDALADTIETVLTGTAAPR